jgi:hypothetical protein
LRAQDAPEVMGSVAFHGRPTSVEFVYEEAASHG